MLKDQEARIDPSPGPPAILNNHKVSCLRSEREGLGKMEKSQWCSDAGAVVLEA